MNKAQIEKLIKKGESEVLELKKSTAQLTSALETVCAFLNGKGGSILIGITNEGKIIGQDVTDNTRREIANQIAKIEPSAQSQINIEYILIEDKKYVIYIGVESGKHIPYIYDGRAFLRNQSTTNRIPQHAYEQLLVRRGQLNHNWEDFATDGYSIDSLDHEEIARTVIEGIAEKRIPASIAKENSEKILRQLNLFTEDGKLKRAAIVLFAKEIRSPFMQCWIKMARFIGNSKSTDFIDSQQSHCNVFRMLEMADNFFRKHLPMASHFHSDQFKRIDKLALPVLALREALVNAVCHRDYSDRSGYISIAIFDDEIEIWSNGTLPDKLRLEDLKRKHDSVLRNEAIAEVFYLRGYIEAWGTGIKKMMDSCEDYGVPIPKFSERTGGFLVTFKFAEPIGGPISIRGFRTTITNRQLEIIKLLEEMQLNSAQIVKKLKNSPSRRMVQIDLIQLEKKGIIVREGKSRQIRWRVK